MADYKKLIPHIKKWEGGWSNRKNDLGGATMMGVTIETYKAYCRRKGYPVPTETRLRSITETEWLDIYKTMFWDKCQADHIKSQNVANMLVDWYWNSGGWAIKKSQLALGLKGDGIVGPITLSALNAPDSKATWRKIREAREEHYRRLARNVRGQETNLRGWLNRLNSQVWEE